MSRRPPLMFGLRQTVALLLIAVGALLFLLGAVGAFAQPPDGVSAEAGMTVRSFFMIGGAVGLGLLAWGIYLRATLSQGGGWPMWVGYAVLLAPIVGLAFRLIGSREQLGKKMNRPSAKSRFKKPMNSPRRFATRHMSRCHRS